MELRSTSFDSYGFIPERFANGRMAPSGETVKGENLLPQLAWEGVPEGTKTFVLCCIDDDVLTGWNDRDLSGEIPASQPRRRFVHWVQANVPADVREVAEGTGRRDVPGAAGLNDYVSGDAPEADGTGLGYDGPRPPFFDARWHVYRWVVLALDVELALPAVFRLADVEALVKGHVLGTAEVSGRYTLNPRLRPAG